MCQLVITKINDCDVIFCLQRLVMQAEKLLFLASYKYRDVEMKHAPRLTFLLITIDNLLVFCVLFFSFVGESQTDCAYRFSYIFHSIFKIYIYF